MLLPVVCATMVGLACRDLTGPRRPGAAARETIQTAVVVVRPGDLHGWQFVDDAANVPCSDATRCALVAGPGTPPLGTGSAELATPATADGIALVLQGYAGTRFDHITSLSYSTYRQSSDAGNNLAIALQVNADYDLTDAAAGYQGRLVFEPYQGQGGSVLQNTWQPWDAQAGRWWGTRATVPKHGVMVANPCVQATPCTWTQLLAAFPDVGIHATLGAVVLKAGSNWAGFRGNVDRLTIGVDSATTTFDFEHQAPFPSTFPDRISRATWDSLTAPGNVLVDAPSLSGRVVRDLLFVAFVDTASVETRAAAIASVNGRVIGGELRGFYGVRIPYTMTPGDSASGPLLRAMEILENNPAVELVDVEHLRLVHPMNRGDSAANGDRRRALPRHATVRGDQ